MNTVPTPSNRLENIRNTIQQLATTSDSDSSEVMKELSTIVKQLDDIIQALHYEQQQLQWKLAQAICDGDSQRARHCIEPLRPDTHTDPHRIDCNRTIGF